MGGRSAAPHADTRWAMMGSTKQSRAARPSMRRLSWNRHQAGKSQRRQGMRQPSLLPLVRPLLV